MGKTRRKKKVAFKRLLILMVVVNLIFSGCTRDMNIINTNNPDTERLISTESDLEKLVGGTFLTFWQGWMYDYPSWALSAMGDGITSTWGNGGVKELTWYPKLPYNNSSTYRYRKVNEEPWFKTYSGILSANDALRIINNGQIDVQNSNRAKAFCKFIQGIGYGSLGLFFDKGIIIDELTQLESHEHEFVDYRTLITSGISYLEECINLCDNTFTTPDTWINGFPMTNEYLKQLCHSLNAKFLAVSPRNPTDRANVDWISVLDHIENGIQSDFAPEGDNDLWRNDLIWNSNRGGWTLVDNRIFGPSDIFGGYDDWINTPVIERKPFDAFSIDRRVTGSIDDPESEGKYMSYKSTWGFRCGRRSYINSKYQWKKHSYHHPEQFGPMPYLTVVEMDMLKAEALMRTGGFRVEVAELINKTRVTIGEMPPLTGDEPDGVLWKWLCYEKRMEVIGSEPGINWYDLRGWADFDFIEFHPGTVVEFPVPGRELELMRLESYTFGSVGISKSTPSKNR